MRHAKLSNGLQYLFASKIRLHRPAASALINDRGAAAWGAFVMREERSDSTASMDH
jgi:hypothetical protein